MNFKITSAILLFAIQSFAIIDYHLNMSANPTADEADAYKRITAAMDSATFIYNKYTKLTKHIEVYYNPGVPTAEASSNGTLSFGSGRNYMVVITAMHEMAHTLGMGTTAEYKSAIEGGVFKGELAQKKLKELTHDNSAELHGDSQHFWPYGLNYASEVKSENDLFIHAQLVEAMHQDLFKETFFATGRLKNNNGKCMGSLDGTLQLLDCESLQTVVSLVDVGGAYRIEFSNRVLDVPNESVAAGVALGTYFWNGGSHQKFIIEKSENDLIFLKVLKSGLYLSSAENFVVQNPKTNSENFLWTFEDLEKESQRILTNSSTSTPIKKGKIYDSKGRRLQNTKMQNNFKIIFTR